MPQRQSTNSFLLRTYSQQAETSSILPAGHRDIPLRGGQVAVEALIVRNERRQAIRGPLAGSP